MNLAPASHFLNVHGLLPFKLISQVQYPCNEAFQRVEEQMVNCLLGSVSSFHREGACLQLEDGMHLKGGRPAQ